MEIEEKSPLVIKVLGWLLIAGGVLFIIKIVFWGSDFNLMRGIWNGFIKFLSVMAGVGFLRLKKWGIYTYFGGFIIGTLVFYILPPSEEVFELYTRPLSIVFLILVPIVVGSIVWKHRHRFN